MWHKTKIIHLCPHKNMHMVIAALFIITKNWKWARCPSVGEWINQLWCTHAMACYPEIKKKKKKTYEAIKRHGGNLNVYIAKWKKPVWKDYILYDFNYVTV